MSIESVADRKRKRVVEYIINGFRSADDAVKFGNTVEQQIELKFKFRQYIASEETDLAVTDGFNGKTALKMTFMEMGQDEAEHICKRVNELLKMSNELHKTNLNILYENVRGKPQAQGIQFYG